VTILNFFLRKEDTGSFLHHVISSLKMKELRINIISIGHDISYYVGDRIAAGRKRFNNYHLALPNTFQKLENLNDQEQLSYFSRIIDLLLIDEVLFAGTDHKQLFFTGSNFLLPLAALAKKKTGGKMGCFADDDFVAGVKETIANADKAVFAGMKSGIENADIVLFQSAGQQKYLQKIFTIGQMGEFPLANSMINAAAVLKNKRAIFDNSKKILLFWGKDLESAGILHLLNVLRRNAALNNALKVIVWGSGDVCRLISGYPEMWEKVTFIGEPDISYFYELLKVASVAVSVPASREGKCRLYLDALVSDTPLIISKGAIPASMVKTFNERTATHMVAAKSRSELSSAIKKVISKKGSRPGKNHPINESGFLMENRIKTLKHIITSL